MRASWLAPHRLKALKVRSLQQRRAGAVHGAAHRHAAGEPPLAADEELRGEGARERRVEAGGGVEQRLRQRGRDAVAIARLHGVGFYNSGQMSAATC